MPSRRLGRSLGVDLVPLKTCTFDCVFCQAGGTTNLTLDRREYVPVAAVVEELAAWLKVDGISNFITLAGSGEPTLHSRFSEVIDAIHEKSSIRCALLSNGSLFSLPEVRAGATKADVVKVSISAWDQNMLERANRPHRQLVLDDIIDGIRTFRSEFSGKLCVEVFALPGINADPDNMKHIAELVSSVKPDQVHLNTAVRPAAEPWVQPVSPGELGQFVELFNPKAEIITEYRSGASRTKQVGEQEILAVLERRPCTAEDIAQVTGLDRGELAGFLGNLVKDGKARREDSEGKIYYGKGSGWVGKG